MVAPIQQPDVCTDISVRKQLRSQRLGLFSLGSCVSLWGQERGNCSQEEPIILHRKSGLDTRKKDKFQSEAVTQELGYAGKTVGDSFSTSLEKKNWMVTIPDSSL